MTRYRPLLRVSGLAAVALWACASLVASSGVPALLWQLGLSAWLSAWLYELLAALPPEDAGRLDRGDQIEIARRIAGLR